VPGAAQSLRLNCKLRGRASKPFQGYTEVPLPKESGFLYPQVIVKISETAPGLIFPVPYYAYA